MNLTDKLFDRMDAWRHLPSYQLERRADLFFSLYLPEVLEAKLGIPVSPKLIPEFPVRIGTIYPRTPINKSFKIDYVALSADAGTALLVELKTEGLSRRDNQDAYLVAAREVGFPALLSGVLDIFRATQAKRKYFALLELLQSMRLIHIPDGLTDIMSRPELHGANEASQGIEVIASVKDATIIYVQPNGAGDDIISFDEFRTIVEKHSDPVSQRFAVSLAEWAGVQAGRARP